MTLKNLPVKFVDGTDDTLRICAVPFGGPFMGANGQGSDLDGERFTKDTDLCLKWFTSDRPLLYHHGHDATVDVDPIGRFESKSITQEDDGWWINAQLDKSTEYFGAITDLVDRGKLYASSGAMAHLIRKDSKGTIKRWPLIEVSLTPTPSNLFGSVNFDSVVKHYKSAGIELDVTEEADELLSEIKARLDVAEPVENVKDGEKVLQESVDTAGGALVPEQVSTEPVSKKKTKSEDTENATEEDKKDTKKSVDFKQVFDYLFEHPEEADAIISKAVTDTEAAKTSILDAVSFVDGDNVVFLVPDASKADETLKAAKDGEVVVAGGRWYDPPEGSLEDWLQDLCRLMNKGLMGPFEYEGYADVLATFGYNGPGYAIVRLHLYDADEDDKYFKVDFDADENGEPTISGTTPYAAVYMPLDQLPGGVVGDDDDMGKSAVPLAMHGEFVISAAKAFQSRTKDLSEKRNKEGRTLSDSNRKRVNDLVAQLKSQATDLQNLLDNQNEPVKADTARLWRELEILQIELEAKSLLGEGVN